MNYIIFGGSGFIGTNLIHFLKNECVKSGDKIYDLDIVMPGEEGIVPGGLLMTAATILDLLTVGKLGSILLM